MLNTAREDVNAWLGHKLDHRYPIIYIDATHVLTRRDDAVSNEAYYTVLGVKEDRTREVLTVVNFPTESATNWKDVFEDLKERGVGVIDLLVCDGLPGIENVQADTFPKADLLLCTVHLKRNIAGKVKPRDKKQVMEELKQVCAPDQWEISPEKAFEKFKEFIARWQKSYSVLKRYRHDRYRFYFTYFKYEREIRGDDLHHQLDRKAEQGLQEGHQHEGGHAPPRAVILLMGTVAQNEDIYKYPIYNFLESRLF